MAKKKTKTRAKREEELRKAVKSYNAKISREAKKSEDVKLFGPQKTTFSKQMSLIETTRDITEAIKSLRRIMEPGALDIIETETGVKMTAYQRNEAELAVDRINRRRRKLEKTGKRLAAKSGSYATVKEQILPERKIDWGSMTGDRWRKFAATIERQKYEKYETGRNQQYKENYMEGARRNMDLDSYNRLADMLRNVSGETMIMGALHNQEMEISYLYIAFISGLGFDGILGAWSDFLGIDYSGGG